MSQKNKLTIVVETGKHEAIHTREFDAPRDKVFNAMFGAEAIPKWWGDGAKVEQFDAKPGGSWATSFKAANGWDVRMFGVFHTATAPERAIRTMEFMPGKVMLETTTFEDLGGRTKMTQQQLYQSVQDRDMVVQYGMEEGANSSYDRLEAMLAENG